MKYLEIYIDGKLSRKKHIKDKRENPGNSDKKKNEEGQGNQGANS